MSRPTAPGGKSAQAESAATAKVNILVVDDRHPVPVDRLGPLQKIADRERHDHGRLTAWYLMPASCCA